MYKHSHEVTEDKFDEETVRGEHEAATSMEVDEEEAFDTYYIHSDDEEEDEDKPPSKRSRLE